MVKSKIIQSKKEIKKIRNKMFSKSFFVYFIIFLFTSVLFYLDINSVINVNNTLLTIITYIMYITIILIVTKFFLRITVNKVFRLFDKNMEVEERIFLTKMYKIFIYAVAASIVLYIIGVTLTNITLFLGLIATGLAFAVRDIIMAFFVWIIILTKKPFRIGDVLSIGDDIGTVTRIGTFFITLKSDFLENVTYIRVPNKVLFDKNFKNHGKGKIVSRVEIEFKKLPKDNEKFLKEFNTLVKKLKLTNYEILFDSKDNLSLVIRFSEDYHKVDNIRSNLLLNIYSKYAVYFMSK